MLCIDQKFSGLRRSFPFVCNFRFCTLWWSFSKAMEKCRCMMKCFAKTLKIGYSLNNRQYFSQLIRMFLSAASFQDLQADNKLCWPDMKNTIEVTTIRFSIHATAMPCSYRLRRNTYLENRFLKQIFFHHHGRVLGFLQNASYLLQLLE